MTNFVSVFNQERGRISSMMGRDVINELGYSCRERTMPGDKSRTVFYAFFYIGNNIIKSVRYIKGDPMDIAFDQEDYSLWQIKRVPVGATRANRLSYPKNSNCHIIQVNASYGPFPRPTGVITLENVVIRNEGILFTFPKEIVSAPGKFVSARPQGVLFNQKGA